MRTLVKPLWRWAQVVMALVSITVVPAVILGVIYYWTFYLAGLMC